VGLIKLIKKFLCKHDYGYIYIISRKQSRPVTDYNECIYCKKPRHDKWDNDTMKKYMKE
jgi:hypothetical protein